MLNDSVRYHEGELHIDDVPLPEIAAACGTPLYIYSLRRILGNYERLRAAFSELDAHIHYSAKANANLSVLSALVNAGAGIDAVSAGEIHRALKAGAAPENIVFAGVGKSIEELRYALQEGIGWFNVENTEECHYINALAAELKREGVKIALRLNPEVTPNTHPYIATGHGGAKFGLTAESIQGLLAQQAGYPHLHFAGIHVHIGSQLHDLEATGQAIQKALDLIAPYPAIRTVNIGGGLPVAYAPGAQLPSVEDFAAALKPLLVGYTVLLEPGRAIVADAGVLVAEVLYIKAQAGQSFYIVDGSMAELMRPALYQAHHEIISLRQPLREQLHLVNVVGPVCETADVLGREVLLPALQPGDLVAILTAGAYGMVMASNYNARPRPPEVVILPDGETWRVARERETWADMLRQEALF